LPVKGKSNFASSKTSKNYKHAKVCNANWGTLEGIMMYICCVMPRNTGLFLESCYLGWRKILRKYLFSTKT